MGLPLFEQKKTEQTWEKPNSMNSTYTLKKPTLELILIKILQLFIARQSKYMKKFIIITETYFISLGVSWRASLNTEKLGGIFFFHGLIIYHCRGLQSKWTRTLWWGFLDGSHWSDQPCNQGSSHGRASSAKVLQHPPYKNLDFQFLISEDPSAEVHYFLLVKWETQHPASYKAGWRSKSLSFIVPWTWNLWLFIDSKNSAPRA